MSTLVVKRVALNRFKASKNISLVHNRTSKKTGKSYFVTEDEEFIGMELPDTDKTKPIFIVTFKDEDTNETWLAVGNSNETTNNYSL